MSAKIRRYEPPVATLTETVDTEPCMRCKARSVLAITPEEDASIERWRTDRKVLIQDALPHWTPEGRELLQTGTHPECWDAMFPEEDS